MWSYRIIRKKIGIVKYYAIHEAYYDDNGKVWTITENPSEVSGDTPEEVVHNLRLMLQDAKKYSVLDYNAIPEKGSTSPLSS